MICASEFHFGILLSGTLMTSSLSGVVGVLIGIILFIRKQIKEKETKEQLSLYIKYCVISWIIAVLITFTLTSLFLFGWWC